MVEGVLYLRHHPPLRVEPIEHRLPQRPGVLERRLELLNLGVQLKDRHLLAVHFLGRVCFIDGVGLLLGDGAVGGGGG
jgi:hypothetical protein